MYLRFLALFIKMCLMMVCMNRNVPQGYISWKCCVGQLMLFVCDTCIGIWMDCWCR